MSRRRFLVAAAVTVGALTLTGCSAAAEPAPSAVSVPAESVTDEHSCTGFGDVLTIALNADAGLRDGRMADQEQQGWYRLATRVLDGVPAREDGAVSDALNALKTVAPPVALAAVQPTGIGSSEWNIGLDELSFACRDAGFETAVNKFTGG